MALKDLVEGGFKPNQYKGSVQRLCKKSFSYPQALSRRQEGAAFDVVARDNESLASKGAGTSPNTFTRRGFFGSKFRRTR
jgi:hypothetical protein